MPHPLPLPAQLCLLSTPRAFSWYSFLGIPPSFAPPTKAFVSLSVCLSPESSGSYLGKHHRNRESTLAQFLAPPLTFSHSPLWGKIKVQVVSTSLRPVVCARCGRRVEITTSRGCRSRRIKQTWENVGHGDEMRETSSVSGVGQKYRWGKYMSRGHPPTHTLPLFFTPRS